MIASFNELYSCLSLEYSWNITEYLWEMAFDFSVSDIETFQKLQWQAKVTWNHGQNVGRLFPLA